MGRVRKRMKRIIIVVVLCILFIIFYSMTGFAKKDTMIDYQVEVKDSTKQLEVTMTVKPTKILFLDLYLSQTKNMDGNYRIQNLEVKKAGKNIAHWKLLPFFSDLERLWVGFNNEPITITYTADPYTVMGDRGKAIGYLSEKYGYFRGLNILYTPLTFREGKAFLFHEEIPKSEPGIGTIHFELPEGWKINNPWINVGNVSIAELRNTYWGLGKENEIIQTGDISIGIFEELEKEKKETVIEQINTIYYKIREMTKILPVKNASNWSISILPPEPIHGGAAGCYSLITDYDITTICHEMFHWWDGRTILAESDANWLSEGLTTYYEGKVLLESGIWSKEDFSQYIGTLIRELGSDYQKPINLVSASERLTKHSTSMTDYYQVYNGGALLAFYIDRELKSEGASLDLVWEKLYNMDKIITNNDFYTVIKELSNKEFADQTRELIEGKTAIVINNSSDSSK